MKKQIEKNGGSRGGSMGGGPGGIRQDCFFEFFAFRNRTQGSARVGRGDNFPPPPPGDTPHW